MLSKIYGFILFIAFVNPAVTQIKGTVIDSETSVPVFGVHVTSVSESTITDKNGNFYLEKEASQIIISHLGFHVDTLAGNEIYHNVVIPLERSVHLIEQISIRGSFNEYPMMQIPSGIGYIPDLNASPSNGISYIEHLNMVPGIFVQTGTLNTNRITVRGIGSRTPYGTNRIKAYYNDIPLTTGDGTTEIEDLNASDIGSVEVLKGSKSALYGAGLGGVIQLNQPEYKEGTNVWLKTSVASYQSLKADLGMRFKKNGFYIRGNFSNAQAAGWRQNSKYNRINLMINTGYSNNKNQFDFLFLAIQTKAYIPSSINEYMFINAPDSAAQNWNAINGYESYNKIIAGVTYKHSFSAKFENKTSFFAHSYDGYESRPFNILDDQSDRIGFRNITALKLKEVKIQAGIEAMFENYHWDIYETLGGEQGSIENQFVEKRQPVAIFLNGQFKIRNLVLLETGISLNALDYQLEDKDEDSTDLSGEYHYDLVYAPFVGLNLPVNKSFRIYSSVSNGFSAPSVEETLLPEGSINPKLKPETGLNAELGIRYKNNNKRIFADVCVYSIWVSDLLVTKRESEDIFYGANAGETWHRGVEFSSTFWLNDSENLFPVSVNVNYSIIKATFTNYVDDGIDYSGRQLPGIPKQHIYLLTNIKSPWGIYLVPVYQLTGKQYMDDSNDRFFDAYHIVNLKIGYSYKIKKSNIDMAFGISNVLNEHYASMILVNAPSFAGASPRYYYPGPPRNYYLTIQYSF